MSDIDGGDDPPAYTGDDPSAYAEEGAVTGRADTGPGEEGADEGTARPEWEDGYLDRVAERLMYNYDLERGHAAGGERFDLYGRMELHSQKHFFHPSFNFAHHETVEHLFARRVDRPRTTDLNRLIELGHDLADERVEANEEHYGTEFTFVLVAEEITDDVAGYVDGFRDRTLLKYGYFGHYEVNLVVVAPEDERLVASEQADVATAFRTWAPIEREEPTILDLIARRFQV
ncbi:hypothetical protein [Halorubrum vacuolatum]|uniref:DUF8052 domain-containing protein n=1 Tax=Halorubrum vacuolatum TaxID=63740 RepID=A0A238WF99_HALVU|nr:hypothetical protein SAMN06264855_107104 [Halorubrum vacuolatum]